MTVPGDLLIQATINVVVYRFAVFTLASLALIGLVVQAVRMLCSHI